MRTALRLPAGVRRSSSGATIRRSHPGWWMTAAAMVAWMVLLGWSVADAVTATPTAAIPAHTMSHHGGHPMGGADAHPHGLGAWAVHWTLMVIAMMWPLYGSIAAAITAASFRRWRVMTVAVFVAVITALWLVFGLAARVAYVLVQAAVPSWVWSLGWLLVAIVATRSMWRARLLRTCGQVRVLAPAGRHAIASGRPRPRPDRGHGVPRCAGR